MTYDRQDLQVHTTWSDGFRGVEGQIYLARTLRLEAIAITDHLFPDLPLSNEEKRKEYRREIERAAAKYGCVTAAKMTAASSDAGSKSTLVLTGIEATATDANGGFTIDERVASEFDWVLCDLSYLSKGTLAETPAPTTAYVQNVLSTYHAMCDARYIDVISHPFNTGNTTPALTPADYPTQDLTALAEHMADTDTVFDVMNLMPLWFRGCDADPIRITEEYTRLVSIFAAAGVRFQLSSDDHRSGLGSTIWATDVLSTAQVEPSLLVDAERLCR